MLMKRMNAMLLVFSVLLVSGCGSEGTDDQPDLGTVTGQVTVDGAAKENLQVIFTPESGRPSQGITDKDGNYKLTYIRDIAGAKIGKHSVRITTLPVTSAERPEDNPPFQELIPAKYNVQTTLSEEVKPGENTINFSLTTK